MATTRHPPAPPAPPATPAGATPPLGRCDRCGHAIRLHYLGLGCTMLDCRCPRSRTLAPWSEAELRAAWGDR